MTDNENLIYIPKDANYIEILGYRIDGFNNFEAFCEHLKKYAELEETVNRLQAENERFENEAFIYKIRWAKAEVRETKAKAEAYKECIEKVKAYFRETRFAYDAENLCEELDELLEEKLGE